MHRAHIGWNSGGTHGEGQRWIGAEWGRVWGGVSPYHLRSYFNAKRFAIVDYVSHVSTLVFKLKDFSVKDIHS